MNISGKWDLNTVENYLNGSSVPMRLSVITSSGYPLVVSMWFVYENGALWCAAQEDSALVRHIMNNENCGFEIAPNEPPYMGVRGRGIAAINYAEGPSRLKILIDKYLDEKNSGLSKWLMDRSDNEVAIQITPECFYSWDYSERMN